MTIFMKALRQQLSWLWHVEDIALTLLSAFPEPQKQTTESNSHLGKLAYMLHGIISNILVMDTATWNYFLSVCLSRL